MKVEWCCKTGYMDIGPAFRLRLATLARMLQESAVTHSEQVGIRSRDLVANGTAGVINKMALSIRRPKRVKGHQYTLEKFFNAGLAGAIPLENLT